VKKELGRPVYSRHLEVTPKPGETADRLIRRFVKKVRNDGVLAEVNDRKGYRKPSEKKRRKKLRSLVAMRKANAEREKL
jgi:ribosomal protein S21